MWVFINKNANKNTPVDTHTHTHTQTYWTRFICCSTTDIQNRTDLGIRTHQYDEINKLNKKYTSTFNKKMSSLGAGK